MSSEGPTTTGSIDAKLTIDKSEWDRKAEEAKTEARELGAMDPTIKVDANVAEAVSKLDAVRVAEQRVETATRQAANTASTAYIANERLAAIMDKRGRTDLQVAAASEASARADRNAEASEIRLIAATEALNKVKAEGVRKTLEEAAANEVEAQSADKETESTKRSVQANNQRVTGLQVLIALAPALLGPATAIAAAGVGLAAAFGVMAGAGVAAVFGIKDAMQDGTAVGNQYATTLGTLKTDLGQLADTSANAMLASFKGTVGDVDARMQYLNTTVGTFSNELGQMGGTAIRGVLDALQQMNPLLLASGVELQNLVTWLFSFNGTNGFQQFIQYAIQNLPATMDLIRNLITLAGHILAAYAPLGPVMLDFLNGLTGGLNNLPLPVLAGLVTTATLLGPALRLAFAPGVSSLIISVAEAIGLTGVMANLAVPVVGILTGILAGVAVMSATAAMQTTANADATNNATIAAQSYAQALQQDNDAIGENVRQMAAKNLQDSGALAAAKTLGIELGTLTDAATGNSAAMKEIQAKMTAVTGAWGDSIAYGQKVPAVLQAQFDAVQKLYPALGLQNEALSAAKDKQDQLTEASRSQTTASGQMASQYGVTVAALQSAQAAQDKTGQSTADTTLKMQLQNDAAGLLKQALDGLNGKALSAAQAQNSFDSSLANMGTHVDKVGKTIKFTTANIGDMSAASVALRGQLNTQVQGLQAVVEANGGLNDSTGKAKAEMEKMRQQIIDNAVAHGVDKDAVTAYVDNLLTIPKSIPPTKLDVDNAAAQAKIDDIKWRLDQMQTHKTIFIDVQQSTSNVDNTGASGGVQKTKAYATGGKVNYLAGGGVPEFRPMGTDTVPAMLTPDEFVVNRASSRSVGYGALDYINRNGQLPPGQQAAPQHMVMTGTLVMDSGEVMGTFRGIARQEAAGAISAANQDASRRASR